MPGRSPADGRTGRLTLSGGERSRLAPAATLLLDEPTNHLSPALVEELEGALAAYRGAVVVVTQDRRLRTRFSGTRLELNTGRLTQCQEATMF
ncbi:hypothetical protein SNOUR_03535 [Streptomyces noursei ATCC 11455]|nr:hypothetical protein SNOUR_03535 [Streptomyces noursei ATCC 11455]